jgi:acetyl esterase/lipase
MGDPNPTQPPTVPTTGATDQDTLANPIDPSILPILDPEFVTYYNTHLASKLATHQVPFASVRAQPAAWRGSWCVDLTGSPGVRNLTIPSADGHPIPLRTYSPDAQKFGPGPYPTHINFHGGGHVFGDLTVDAIWCVKVRDSVGCVVVDVDYRLCPEWIFGKNIEDGWAALNWVVERGAEELNVNPRSVSIGGVSAGAGICATLQHMARDKGVGLRIALLSVPTMDYTTYFPVPEGVEVWASVGRLERAPSLGADRIRFFKEMVFPEFPAGRREEILKLPLVWRAPLRGENFKGLCNVFVATAECDPLVDEGEAYAKRCLEGGAKVQGRRYRGMPHPFMHLDLKASRLYDQDLCTALRGAHGLV